MHSSTGTDAVHVLVRRGIGEMGNRRLLTSTQSLACILYVGTVY